MHFPLKKISSCLNNTTLFHKTFPKSFIGGYSFRQDFGNRFNRECKTNFFPQTGNALHVQPIIKLKKIRSAKWKGVHFNLPNTLLEVLLEGIWHILWRTQVIYMYNPWTFTCKLTTQAPTLSVCHFEISNQVAFWFERWRKLENLLLWCN